MPHADYTPQLATLVKSAPTGDSWLHEIKFDGYRIGCRMRSGRVALISRNGKDWTAAFPEIVEAAEALRLKDGLIDGEVAMVLPDGRTSFQLLQNAFSGDGPRASLVYFVFAGSRRVAGTECALGEAAAGVRGRVQGVDRRREDPSPIVPGITRRQEAETGDARKASPTGSLRMSPGAR